MLKKLIFLSLFFTSLGLYAQGNLQFNRVKLVAASDTVPTGKVWKIESVIYSTPIVQNGNATTAFSIGTDATIIINGSSIVTRSSRGINSSQGGAYYALWNLDLPIWLPAGSTLASSTGVHSISIIEFNVVP